MLIQCTQCQTVYNFDDSALQDSSIDVRCARCQTVFTIDASSAVDEDVCRVDESELQGMSFRSAATDTSSKTAQPASEMALFEPEPEQTFEAPPVTQSHIDLHPQPEPANEETGAEEEFSFTPTEQPPTDDDTGFDFAPLDEAPAQEKAPTDVAFTAPDGTAEAEKPAESAQQEQPRDLFAEPETAPSKEEEEPQWQGTPDDFTFEDSGEDFSFEDEASWSTDKPETPARTEGPSQDTEDSPDFIFEPLTRETKPAPSQPASLAEESPLSSQEDMEQTVAAPAEPEKPQTAVRPAERAPRPQKRGTSKFLLFILFLLLVVAGAYGYFYATLGTTDVRVMIREIQQLVMPSGPQQPQGALTIIRSESYYIDNSEAGALFVIQGTIRNDYNEPRAELSVTATLYKDKGQPFTKKNGLLRQ